MLGIKNQRQRPSAIKKERAVFLNIVKDTTTYYMVFPSNARLKELMVLYKKSNNFEPVGLNIRAGPTNTIFSDLNLQPNTLKKINLDCNGIYMFFIKHKDTIEKGDYNLIIFWE